MLWVQIPFSLSECSATVAHPFWERKVMGSNPVVPNNIMTYLFIFLSLSAIICGFSLIFVKNPVHSVLFLILVFVNISGLLILLQTDFLALLFLLVYIGAIAVLFLFIVMMLNIKLTETNQYFLNFEFYCIYVTSFVLFSLICYFTFSTIHTFSLYRNSEYLDQFVSLNQISDFKINFLEFSNVKVIGSVLYTLHVYHFLLAGLILLIAMVGAIVLTMQEQSKVRRQHIFQQISRNSKRAVCLTTLN